MPVDRRDRERLIALAKLQQLRLAQEEMALAEAREALHQAEGAAVEARGAFLLRKEELARLLTRESFTADRLQLQGALVSADEALALDAEARLDGAMLAENERRRSWSASRRRLEHLRASRRATERQLVRKAEERALADILSPAGTSEAQS